MSNTIVKLQIPLDKSLRDKVARHARAQGFSSIQDFTRVMYSTMIRDNLLFHITISDEALSPEAESRYARQLAEHESDRRAGKVKSYDSVENFLADLKKA